MGNVFKSREIENNLLETNYYYRNNVKCLYDKPRYQVRYNMKMLKTNRVFETLEEAKAFKELCDNHIAKAKFNASRGISNVDISYSEYPENLLYELGINDETYDNYYYEILPNFEKNFEKIRQSLLPRELQVIDMFFKSNDNNETIGKALGVTRERVRQIVAKTIRKIKARINILVDGIDKYELVSKEEREEIIKNMTKEIAIELLKNDYDIVPKKQYDNEIQNNISINVLDFSVRTYNCLKRAKIKTIGELLTKDIDDFMKIKNLGQKSLKEIRDKLKEYQNER